jgi:hypothetical protein
MSQPCPHTACRIRQLNDDFRRSFIGGAVVVTAGVDALPKDRRRSLLRRVREFQDFSVDNDPHGEHDFGAVEEQDVRCFWKIDYFDREMSSHSPNAADPTVTTRVLTVMLAEEY